jgi:UDP-galactose transporter B1
LKLGTPSTPLLWQYAQLALVSVLASPFGYASLKYIDYPTMILGKSCKLIPVMIMNFVLYRKTFPLQKYLIVALITAGVSIFMLLQPLDGKKKASASTAGAKTLLGSLWGLFLLSLNLALDGVTNSTQDRIFHTHRSTSGSQMMFFMNFFSTIIMALYLLLSNPFNSELSSAIAFGTTHPAVFRDILLFGVCGALGQCFIFHTIENFSSITTVTITLTRKMFSIVLSVLLYNHKLALGQWLGVLVVFVGITLEAFLKSKKGGKDDKKVKKEKVDEIVNQDDATEVTKEVSGDTNEEEVVLDTKDYQTKPRSLRSRQGVSRKAD